MTLASELLPTIDSLRGIAGDLGFRPYTVTVRVTTWDGDRVGLGTATTTSTQLIVGGQNPKVAQLSARDIIASGGLYQDQDLRVGPLTPSFPGGGVATSTINPADGSSPTEIDYLLTGPGLDAAGEVYQRIGGEVTSPIKMFVILRKVGK